MKWLMCVFAFYILLLPLQGIAGNETCDQLAHFKANENQGVDHKENHHENCNPFCNCECCFHTAPSQLGLYKMMMSPVLNIPIIYDLYKNECYISGILKNIWQPPKA